MVIEARHFFEFGPFRLDPSLRILLRDGQPVPVQPKTFDILLALVQNNDRLVSKEDLMKAVWQNTFVEESNLTQNIFVLRKILGQTAGENRYIVTVPGRGYRFVGEVRKVADENGQTADVGENHSPVPTIPRDEIRPNRKALLSSKTGRLVLAVAIVVIAFLGASAVMMYSPVPPPKVLRVRQITHSGSVAPYSPVVSDGMRLYFAERIGGTDALAEAPVAGGDPTPVSTTIPSAQVYDIDQSKSKLLIGTQSTDFSNPLWVVATSGGSGRRLGDVLASGGSVWSPDGRTIFYGNNTQIYRISDGGAEPRKLLTAPGLILSVRLSPDQSRLRFTSQDIVSGGTSLWEAAADGSNPRPFSLGWKKFEPQWGEGESFGEWTPDGKYFIFRAARDGVEGFWALRETKSWFRRNVTGPVQIYASPDRLGGPRFSPDGKKIFFVSYQERRELVRYDSAKKMFVPYLAGIPVRLLSFSPDGKWVSYRNEIDGSLWRSREDGKDKLQLTFPPMVAYHSSWSPDGKTIVFGASVPGMPSQLYSVPFGGGTSQLIAPSDASDSEPSCSPDGRSILFLRRPINGHEGHQSDIYSLDFNTHVASKVPGSLGFEGVHVSPDGKYAAASDEINHKLMLLDIKRGQWSELSDGAPYGWGIRWSSDSQYVYYQHLEEGKGQPIFRVRIRDRKIEQITSARQIPRADMLGYTMTGLTPNDEPLATLIHRNSDIYALDLDLP
jgi:DNA-binding winged helix-turn-helix (wHTH) protein/Tol biopolymer transport system component